jgi:hypothetical protein
MTIQVMTSDVMTLKKYRRAALTSFARRLSLFSERADMAALTEKPTSYSLLPSWGYIAAGEDMALKRLVGGIIGQAARDALENDKTGEEARDWLLSIDCAEMCEFIELNFRAVKMWVDAGCPDWRSLSRNDEPSSFVKENQE